MDIFEHFIDETCNSKDNTCNNETNVSPLKKLANSNVSECYFNNEAEPFLSGLINEDRRM